MISIEIDMIEKISTNVIYAGVHWSKRDKHKELYLCATKLALTKSKIKIESFPVDLDMKFYFKSHALDASNCSYMGKIIEDCLKENRIIPDDTPEYVSSIKFSSIKGKQNKIIVNIIEPIKLF